MEKILEIASGITNPYSLVALTYLVLFVLFKVILTKIGLQTEQRGYKVIMRLMSLVAGIAVLTLLSVLGFKVYKVHAETKS